MGEERKKELFAAGVLVLAIVLVFNLSLELSSKGYGSPKPASLEAYSGEKATAENTSIFTDSPSFWFVMGAWFALVLFFILSILSDRKKTHGAKRAKR